MDYLAFWWDCLKRAFSVSRGLIEVIGFIIVLVVGLGLWAATERRYPKIVAWVSKIPGLKNETSRTSILFLILFLGYLVSVGPYSIYSEQKAQILTLAKSNEALVASREIDELAKLTKLAPQDAKLVSDALWRSEKRDVYIVWSSVDIDARVFANQLESIFTNAGFGVGMSYGAMRGSEGQFSMPHPDSVSEPLRTALKKIAQVSNRKVNLGGNQPLPTNAALHFAIGTRLK